MLKKITTSQLQIGMYIHALDCHWIDHPFFRSSFVVDDPGVIEKIKGAGLQQIIIDTGKGSDFEDQVTDDKSNQSQNQKSNLKNTSVVDELNNARSVYTEATQIIRSLMHEVRLGKQVKLEEVEPIAERIVSSVTRNKDALVSLTRIKNRDEYTFMHCVSVSGLMATFARYLGMSQYDIEQVTMGGLLHDIGKILVPDYVLNKPAKLTDDEFDIMRLHVKMGHKVLSATTGITQQAMDVVLMHHERLDGSGYPYGLKGDELTKIGRMASIVDVYDALTSVRCYKDAWEPASTLKHMLEWGGKHFDKELVEKFIRCLGIYPVGSVVELTSGLVGIVMEQHEDDLLRPTLRIVYNIRYKKYVQVRDMDLKKTPEEKIIQAISPAKYNIDISVFI